MPDLLNTQWVAVGTLALIAALVIYGLTRHPKYCEQCGMALVRRRALIGFDTRTGKRRSYHYWACPHARGDNRGEFGDYAMCDSIPLRD